MAYSEFPPTTFDPTFLNANEQDLLTTALNSNQPAVKGSVGGRQSRTNTLQSGLTNGEFYASPLDQPDSGNFDSTPYLDYDADETNFDWDVTGQMIGDLPDTNGQTEVDDETGEKRKNPDDDDDDEESLKRRTSEDKTNKKPGRKPLTSEPTSKRKAQNRAAQRAFRERKERHLKELESKVEDLEKASESANHENGLLRAQVERLQTELREYRKRVLSTNSAPNRTPPQSNTYNMSSKSAWDINHNFQFAFPRFNPFGTEANLGRNNSLPVGNGMSNGNAGLMGQTDLTNSNNLQVNNSSMDPLSGLFSPSILNKVDSNSDSNYIDFSPSASGRSPAAGKSPAATSVRSKASGRATSDNDSNSPASSANNGFTSSCVTTPEYTAESPEQLKSGEHGTVGPDGLRRRSSTKESFCDEFAKACGNKENPVPRTLSESHQTPLSSANSTVLPHTPTADNSGFDWFATQNGGAFDPILFGDYRDPQENIMTGDYGGFFQDAFTIPDLGEQPLGIEPMPKKRDLMKEIEETQSGKEHEVVPGDHPKQFLTCNMLWDRVQRSEKVQNGEADMDDLCAQLKSKAKCSGNGAVIDQKDVDAILGPAPADTKDFFKMFK